MPHVRTTGWLAVAIALLAAPSATAKAIPAASAFSLPSTQRCVAAGSTLTLRLRKVHHVKWLGATIKVDGRRVKTVKRSKVTQAIRLAHLPRTGFVLSISAKANHHRSAKARRGYHACDRPAPAPKPPAPAPAPTASPTPQPPAPLSPGSYSGGTSQGRAVSFYLAADSKHLLDVSVNVVDLTCSPGKSFSDQLAIGQVTLDAHSGFSSATTQDGVLFGAPAHFTYTFTGHLSGATATGTLKETITYDDGTKFTCSSDTQTWSTTRDTQGEQANALASPGSFSGGTSQGRAVSFYVSTDRTHLEDVAVGVVDLGCTPGKFFSDQMAIPPDVAIAADGSFSSTTTQDGVLFGVPAHFTYTFSGHLHGLTSAGVPRAGGTLREDITYDDGTAFDCTSNVQTWSTTRDAQGLQTGGAPPTGTYSGGTSQGRAVGFYVAADRSHLQDVSVGVVDLGCAPSKFFSDRLAIPEIAIAADGSFTATTTEDGVIAGEAAHFTFTFSGHMHGPTTAGVARAAGTLRERITYDDGTAFDCTSNVQRWTTTRDAQGTGAAAPPPAGAYAGGTSQGRAVSFTVSADHLHLTTVSVPVTDLACTPSKFFSDHLTFDDVDVAADGSFTATSNHDSPLFGVTGHFTYTFAGHFHGPGSGGVARAAGTLRERITYDDGTAHDCTTNTQTWTANRS